jgi:signal transduction histidine kinase
MEDLPGRARLLIAACVAGGVGVLVWRLPELADWSGDDALLCAGIAVAVALSQQFVIPVRHRNETEYFDMTEVAWAAGLLLAVPSVVTLGVGTGILAGQAVRRVRPHKIAFNVGQDLVGVSLALVVYGALAGPADEPRAWLAAALGMGAYLVFNAVVVAAMISIVEGEPLLRILAPSLPLNLLQWTGNVALGILVAVLWLTQPAALPLLAAPLLLSYLTYRGWLRSVRERERMNDMARTADAIAAGDLERRIPEPDGFDEVAPLAHTLNRMLDKLDGAFQRERRFFREASHELRTPVAICRGHLEVLGRNPDPADLRETIELVLDELALMGRVLEDMATLALAEQPQFVRRERIEMDTFLPELAVRATPVLNSRLRMRTVPGASVHADPQRLTQALMNLLSNASVHGAGDGIVRLNLTQQPDGWRFEVADEGGGFPAGQEDLVFRPFWRGRATAPGTGLGLAIVRRIAVAHGGEAGVANRPGEGSTFWIRIPCEASPTEGALSGVA